VTDRELVDSLKAAISTRNGIFSLPRPARHGDVFRYMQHCVCGAIVPGSVQGFLDSEGRFWTRAEAFDLAERAIGVQVKSSRVLFTEDLW